jgi:alkane 1-monooxygenase
MTRAALAFSATSLLPVPLLALAAMLGGGWAWLALVYLTLFTFAMDEMIAWVAPDGGREFPAADLLSVVLALAHLALMALVVMAFGRGLGLAEAVALFLATGLFFGQVGNSNAHELIHRGSRRLHGIGKWVYISLGFGHHTSAHPLVHHVHVGSDADPNSARGGEGYYRFVLRAWPGSFRAGLAAESARRRGRPLWQHPYLQYFAGAGLFAGLALWLGGLAGLLVWLGLCAFAQSQLLLSDYVQHYGLRRRVMANGRLEKVGPQHSWNAPHRFSSNLMLNAPRHSDHHAHPGRKFPELRLHGADEAPTLPHSLPAMSLLALAPPLWRWAMDPRVAHWRRRAAAAA